MKKELYEIIKNNKNIIIFVCFTFVCLSFFYFCIPLTSDDFFWGGKQGLDQLQSLFRDYNGRYLGNICVIILTRFKIIRVIFMPVIVIALCCQISKFVTQKISLFYYSVSLTAFLLLAFVPKIKIFSQTISWISGFSNYVVVTLLLFIELNQIKKDYYSSAKTCSWIKLLLSFSLGIISCLFLENITLTCVFLGFSANILFFVFTKQINKRQTAYFVGTITGSIIMFSNNSYIKMFSGDYSDGRQSGFRQIGIMSFEDGNRIYLLIIFVLILLVLVFLSFAVSKEHNHRFELLSLLSLIIITTFPLIFTNGGSIKYFTLFRIYFPQLALLVVYFLDLINIAVQKKSKESFRKKLGNKFKTIISSVIFVIVFVLLIIPYFKIHLVEASMEKHLFEQMENKKSLNYEIIVYPPEYDKYIHEMNLFETSWNYEFKDFYCIPMDAELYYTISD